VARVDSRARVTTSGELFAPGDVVAGRYRIEELVGRGGFGAVYRAVQLALGRSVALKMLLPELVMGRSAERFFREAELAQRLEHPNSVRLYDFGRTEQGVPYIAWELLRGRSLEQVMLAEGPLPPARVARIGIQVLKALMEAHSLGIVHRDIKPSNVMLCDFAGESDFVKVLDFGIAKQLGDGEQPRALTEVGHLVGTPSYMAPELVLGGVVTPQSDLYALGLMLADALSGYQTVRGNSYLEICMQQAASDPVPLSQRVLGSPLAGVIQRATQKENRARYASAQEMLRDLEAFSSSPPLAYQPTALTPAPLPRTPSALSATLREQPRPASHGPILWLFGGLAALAILGLVAIAVVAVATRPSVKADPAAATSDARGLSALGEAQVRKRIEKAGWDVTHVDRPQPGMLFFTVTKPPHGGSVQITDHASESTAKYTAELMQEQGYACARDGQRVVLVAVLPKDGQGEKLLETILGKR
jgi:serine/threonine protein kinase